MPSEMFERGRRDAEADALDENYYQYYYDYKLGYDEVLRHRRRTRRQLFLGRAGRVLLSRILPLALILGGLGFAAFRYLDEGGQLAAAPTPSPTRIRPTLIPPTPRPQATPKPELALRVEGFAVISGTDGAPLVARKGPGTGSAKVTNFAEGQTVKILEGPQDANGLQWWRIEGDGKSGWSAGKFLKPVDAPAQ